MADLDIANQSDFPIKENPTATTLLVASDGGDPFVVEGDRYMMAFKPSAYGADPTGVTESSTEIQACIDACQAANGVLDLRGTWLIDTGLVVDGALDSIEIIGGPVNRGATPHSSGWAAALIADTGFTGTLLTITDTRGIKMRGVGIDMSDADSTAIGMLVEGTYWGHFEDIHVDGCQAIGISIRGGTAGNYWGVWERCHVNADDGTAAASRAGTGWFIDRNDANTTWVNQQHFVQCSSNFLNIGWDVVEPGAGFLWDNCQAESGNTSTGIGVRLTEPFEVTYLEPIWRGGEINNYATGVSGRLQCEYTINLSATARTNGASETYYDGRAANNQNRRVITYSEDSYAEVVQKSNGTYGDPIAGFVAQDTTVASGSTTTVLTLPADQTGNLHSGFLNLTVQCLTSVWQNTRRLYHLTTYWDSNGSGTLTLINGQDETAVPGLAVTFTHTGGVWSVQVAQTSGQDCRVRAHYSGLIPGV